MENMNTILIFVVGVSDAEANHIVSIHSTYNGAFKAWNDERIKIIEQCKRSKYFNIVRGWSHDFDNNNNEEIKNLSCEDPKKIDNYPQETPYIATFELLD